MISIEPEPKKEITEKFKVETFENPGSTSTDESNEDLADFIVYEDMGYAWVFDGASGLADPLLDEPSDGKWYVQEFNQALRREIEASDWEREIKDIVRTAMESVKKAYEESINRSVEEVPKVQNPSSKISLARWNFETNELETYGLGDSVQLVEKEESTDYVTHGGPIDLDNRVFYAMSLIQRPNQSEEELADLLAEYDVGLDAADFAEERFSHKEVRENELIREMLHQHRSMKNTEQGYWTLGFDRKAVENGVEKTYDLAETGSIALFTDGVSPAITSYGIKGGRPYKEAEFLNKVKEEGSRDVLREIVSYERNDSECETHIRFKMSDDKALVYVNFF